jgi:hypothetical protein
MIRFTLHQVWLRLVLTEFADIVGIEVTLGCKYIPVNKLLTFQFEGKPFNLNVFADRPVVKTRDRKRIDNPARGW